MTSLSTEYPTLKPGSTVTILYVNGSGETSERTITVGNRYVSGAGVTYLRAYCHLRQEYRTFRLDRVLGVLESDASPAELTGTTAPVRAVAPSALPSVAPRRVGSGSQSFPVRTGANSAARPIAPSAQRTASVYMGIPAPTPRAVSQPAKKRHPVRRFLMLACMVFVFLLLFEDHFQSVTIRATLFPQATAALEEARAERREPPPPPPDATWTDSYRGQAFRADRKSGVVTYTLTSSGKQFSGMHALRVEVNESLLAAAWGVRHPELTRMFGNADANRDGWLSWGEITHFQSRLFRSYRYLTNATALRPEQFLAAGGGDCEDWAIMTAVFLRFWGMNPAIGSISSSTGQHAVTFVPASNVPEHHLLITAWDPTNMDFYHEVVYTPVDYYVVGGLSGAVGTDYQLTTVYHPPDMFGMPL